MDEAKMVEKEKQIPRAFARLDEALDRLEEAIKINNNGLLPLLRDEPNDEGKEMLKRVSLTQKCSQEYQVLMRELRLLAKRIFNFLLHSLTKSEVI